MKAYGSRVYRLPPPAPRPRTTLTVKPRSPRPRRPRAGVVRFYGPGRYRPAGYAVHLDGEWVPLHRVWLIARLILWWRLRRRTRAQRILARLEHSGALSRAQLAAIRRARAAEVH